MTVDILGILQGRLLDIAYLSIPEDKKGLVEGLVTRYTSELADSLKEAKVEDEVKSCFNHYINNILSILETMSGSTFKSIRRLALNEIHGAKEVYLSGMPK